MTPQLISINVALPRKLPPPPPGWPQDPPQLSRMSGIYKEPVAGPIWLGMINLDGDRQADLQNHGGEDKAVNAYPADHYPAWRAALARPEMTWGAFGENFTIAGLDEETVCIGDIYQVGPARVQVTQPRQPCWKLARKWGVKDLVRQVERARRTGWYFRVLVEGEVGAGLPIVLLDRPHPEWTIARAFVTMHRRKRDPEAAAALAACPELAASWREVLAPQAVAG